MQFGAKLLKIRLWLTPFRRNWASPDTGLIKGNVMAPVADLFNHHLGDM